jgi:hypothetical protein
LCNEPGEEIIYDSQAMVDKPNLQSGYVIAVGMDSTNEWAPASKFTDQAWTTGHDYQQVCSIFDDASINAQGDGWSSGDYVRAGVKAVKIVVKVAKVINGEGWEVEEVEEVDSSEQ